MGSRAPLEVKGASTNARMTEADPRSRPVSDAKDAAEWGRAQSGISHVDSVEGYQEKLARDLHHVKYRSLFLDLVIFPQTVKTVLHFRGM